ncbi:glutamate synthase, partial [Burkholderia pseudomallei]
NVYRPDIGAITTTNYYTSFCTGGTQIINLPTLPASGTYTLAVYSPNGGVSSGQITLVPGSTGTLASNGATQSFAPTLNNQNIYLSFNANLGDNLELTLSNLNATNTYYFHVDVYDSHGNNISSNPCYVGNGTCRYALWNLAAGTYSVILSPAQSNSSISVNAQVEPDVIGPAISANTPATVNLVQGEVERLTFNGNLGDTVALQISGVSGQQMCVNVYRPDIGAITTTNYYTSFCTGGTQIINLPTLPASGTYTLAVYSPNGGVSSGQITLVPGSTGTLASNGATQSFAPTLNNQNIYLSFNANLGDNLELTLSNLNATNTYYFHVDVYDSHGNNISSNPCYVGNG